MGSEQLDQLKRFLHAQARAYEEINRLVEILLGDICAAPTASLKGFFKRNGITAVEFGAMTVDQRLEKINAILKSAPTRAENLAAALDLIFEGRYGWQEGTGGKLPLWDAYLALEHAMEYDCPGKPSVWDLTK